MKGGENGKHDLSLKYKILALYSFSLSNWRKDSICASLIVQRTSQLTSRFSVMATSDVPSVTSFTASSTSTSTSVDVLRRLFPSVAPEELAKLSRQDLFNLARQDSSLPQRSKVNGAVRPGSSSNDGNGEGSENSETEENSHNHEWNEPQEMQDPEEAVCDDVNGLSLSVYRRSYMGISSVHAVLRTIFRTRPSLQMQLRTQFSASQQDHAWRPNPHAALALSPSDAELRELSPAVTQEVGVDAYFSHVHAIMPLIDPVEFRESLSRQDRSDRPWLALLNMVLALGSLCVEGNTHQSSQIYYARAKAYIDLELLGMGCVDTLRALCLLGGVYLHYKNAPNTAYAIMGLAYRIAIALGLHRSQQEDGPNERDEKSSRMRRKMWWSLFCLDTWGSMSLGRPTLGRWDPATMDVASTSLYQSGDSSSSNESMKEGRLDHSRDGHDEDGDLPFITESLNSARQFCMIATKVQHRFAQRSPITTGEIAALDAEVTDWYCSLPPQLGQLDRCPPHLLTAQYVIRNRYYNLRVLLYRPLLLRYANSRKSFDSIPGNERRAVQQCRDLSCETIEVLVSGNHGVDRIRVCSSVWYLYQACLVLLLSLLTDKDSEDSTRWKTALESALVFFEVIDPWSTAAGRTIQVVRGLLTAITSTPVPPPIRPVVPDESFLDPNNPADTTAAARDSWDALWGELGFEFSADQNWDWDAFNHQLQPQVDVEWYGGE